MKVIICGSRDLPEGDWIYKALDALNASLKGGIEKVITGGARGADAIGQKWAKSRLVETQTFIADWKAHGKAAGPIRNQKMIDEAAPGAVIAFPGGKGTADMVRRAKKADLLLIECKP